MLYKKESGFTLIELLVVVIVMAVLSGVLISIIDPTASQGRARDGVRLNNVKNLAEGIESYRQLEGEYPLNGDPTDENSLLRQTYIKDWPRPLADNGSEDPINWSYIYAQNANGFVLSSPNSRGTCYKYQTNWAGMLDCPASECAAVATLASDCTEL